MQHGTFTAIYGISRYEKLPSFYSYIILNTHIGAYSIYCAFTAVKVESMQRPGTPNPELKTQREITKSTNSQNKNRIYGQPTEQLFPKRWQLSNPNRNKNNMNTSKVKSHRISYTKNREQRNTTKLQPWNGH